MRDKDARLRHLIRDVASEIVQDPEVRRMVREVVLSSIVEQNQIRNAGIVRSFLSDCGARGIRVRMADDGKLMFTNGSRLTAELRAVLFVERQAIAAHLEQIRFMEARRQMEHEKDRAARQDNKNKPA